MNIGRIELVSCDVLWIFATVIYSIKRENVEKVGGIPSYVTRIIKVGSVKKLKKQV